MKFRPLHDRVVVKRLEEELKTKGGIIIPDTAAEKPQTGQVVAAGPGSRGEDGKCNDDSDEPRGHGHKKAHGRTPSQACERPPTGARIPFVTLTPERHGPGGPTGLQNRCGRATHGSVGSTPAPLRSCKSRELQASLRARPIRWRLWKSDSGKSFPC